MGVGADLTALSAVVDVIDQVEVFVDRKVAVVVGVVAGLDRGGGGVVTGHATAAIALEPAFEAHVAIAAVAQGADHEAFVGLTVAVVVGAVAHLEVVAGRVGGKCHPLG